MTGTLFVVATPIGNLSDASPRALEILRSVELIACEDTRVTRTLLALNGIPTRTVSLHGHNEKDAAHGVLATLLKGHAVALVSDAGTPALSDPGALLVELAHRAGVRVSPIPGPSAAAAAISICGFAAPQFLFCGFLPASTSGRRKALQALDVPWPVVLYEAPHRIAKLLADLRRRFGDEREVLLCRELTKKFEEVVRLPLGDYGAWLAAAPHREQGEFVLVIAPGAPAPARTSLEPDAMLEVLLEALPPSEAAKLAARLTGAPKNDLYRKALGRAKPGAK